MLFGAIEVATVIGTITIRVKGSLDVMLEISKNGYKIDKRKMEEYKIAKKEDNKSNPMNKVLGTIVLLTPGVNLLTAHMKNVKAKKEIMNNQIIKDALIPMTEEEKEQYANLNSKWEKLAFASFVTQNEDKNKVLYGFSNGKAIVMDRKTAEKLDELYDKIEAKETEEYEVSHENENKGPVLTKKITHTK